MFQMCIRLDLAIILLEIHPTTYIHMMSVKTGVEMFTTALFVMAKNSLNIYQ